MFYFVFVGDSYYPEPGWVDHVGTTESLDEARRLAEGRDPAYQWHQIVAFGYLSGEAQIVEGVGFRG